MQKTVGYLVPLVLLANPAHAGDLPAGGQTTGGDASRTNPPVTSVIPYANGGYYRGGMLEGKRHGQGVYLYPDYSIYTGRWRNGLKDGVGVYKWPSGNIYEGEWKNGSPHGPGTLTFADGGILEGRWVEGAAPSFSERAAGGVPEAQRASNIRETRCRLIGIVSEAYERFADYFAAQGATSDQEDEADRVFTRGIDQPCP